MTRSMLNEYNMSGAFLVEAIKKKTCHANDAIN